MATYVKPIVCENCGATTPAFIPKGQTVDDFMRATNCPVCGCKTKRTEYPSTPSYPWVWYPYYYQYYVYPSGTGDPLPQQPTYVCGGNSDPCDVNTVGYLGGHRA